MAALLQLKRATNPPKSRLEPPGGLPALSAEPIAHAHLSTTERLQLRDAGATLRRVRALAGLSVAEATVLRNLMDRHMVHAGDHLVRRGEQGDSLVVIESGQTDVRVTDPGGYVRVARRLGPGDHFGEIALLMGLRRTADVIATEPTSVLVLSKDHYERYLVGIPGIDAELTRVAVNRLANRLESGLSAQH
jgi:CRP-like cAMP-binding protein